MDLGPLEKADLIPKFIFDKFEGVDFKYVKEIKTFQQDKFERADFKYGNGFLKWLPKTPK